jgi:serine/threonine protein kinase
MLETGTILQDRFLIEKELAHGGMGAVYLARDQKFGSCVAIKQRVHEGGGLAEAFEREARLLNTLHHPILPHVSDYFSEGSDHFLVMEFIEGEDLSEVLKRDGAFAVDNVVTWTLELLDGLDYLHSQDPPVIHRDIKPGNLKITSRGNIVLLDFGLAKESPKRFRLFAPLFAARADRGCGHGREVRHFLARGDRLPPFHRPGADRRHRPRFGDSGGSARPAAFGE